VSKQSEVLRFRQEQLKRQINDALQLLQGSLHKNPSQRGYHLTLKVDQKTVTQYVRKELVLSADGQKGPGGSKLGVSGPF
jgi:hypothetical protein